MGRLLPFLLQTIERSLLKATLAFAILGSDFIVDHDATGQCATKVSELVHGAQLLAVDTEVWLRVELSWSWLMHHLRLLC